MHIIAFSHLSSKSRKPEAPATEWADMNLITNPRDFNWRKKRCYFPRKETQGPSSAACDRAFPAGLQGMEGSRALSLPTPHPGEEERETPNSCSFSCCKLQAPLQAGHTASVDARRDQLLLRVSVHLLVPFHQTLCWQLPARN